MQGGGVVQERGSPGPASRLTLQLEKVYDPKNEEDDMREMEEERLRMREHVMKNVRRAWPWGGSGVPGGPSCVAYPYLALQVDTNQDRLVTLEEFLASTQRKEFGDTGEGWEVRTWRNPKYVSPIALTFLSEFLSISLNSLSLYPLSPWVAVLLSLWVCPLHYTYCISVLSSLWVSVPLLGSHSHLFHIHTWPSSPSLLQTSISSALPNMSGPRPMATVPTLADSGDASCLHGGRAEAF